MCFCYILSVKTANAFFLVFFFFFSPFLVDILQNRKLSRCFSRCHRGSLEEMAVLYTRTLENYLKVGERNPQLCSLRSGELELKGFEIAAIKSGRFYFYSCVREQIQKPSSQTVFFSFGSCETVQGLQCKLLCKMFHL